MSLKFVFLMLLLWVPVAGARIGESLPQCERRYGNAVTNYPGFGDIAGVSQYVIDDVTITIWFQRVPFSPPSAAMVLYARALPAQSSRLIPKTLSDDQQNAILQTIPGQWSPYKKADRLSGRPSDIVGISTSPSIVEQRRDQARPVLENALRALFPDKLLEGAKYWIDDIGYNSPRFYGFEAMRGVAIVSYDGLAAIDKWAAAYLAARQANEPPPPPETQRF